MVADTMSAGTMSAGTIGAGTIGAGQASTAEQGRLDWIGVLCSFGCAIHCAAMPVLVATLPSLTSLRWLADPLFHQVVAVSCGFLVARAIVPGYRRHRDSRVVTLAGIGLGMLFIAAFILPDTCCTDPVEPNIVAPNAYRSHKIVLVSSNGATNEKALSKLGSFIQPDEHPINHSEVCESRNCSHAATLSRPLLTGVELEEQLGKTSARTLIQAQPYLSPIGGMFLIVAHILNIRLRCCRRSTCRSK